MYYRLMQWLVTTQMDRYSISSRNKYNEKGYFMMQKKTYYLPQQLNLFTSAPFLALSH